MILSTISLPYKAEPTKSQNLHHLQGSSTNYHPSIFYWQNFAKKIEIQNNNLKTEVILEGFIFQK
jgi:hypothetical protein